MPKGGKNRRRAARFLTRKAPGVREVECMEIDMKALKCEEEVDSAAVPTGPDQR